MACGSIGNSATLKPALAKCGTTTEQALHYILEQAEQDSDCRVTEQAALKASVDAAKTSVDNAKAELVKQNTATVDVINETAAPQVGSWRQIFILTATVFTTLNNNLGALVGAAIGDPQGRVPNGFTFPAGTILYAPDGHPFTNITLTSGSIIATRG